LTSLFGDGAGLFGDGAGTDLADVVAFGTRIVRHGWVTTFDEERGIGTVAVQGGSSFAFHITAIADGSRQIAIGSRVSFVVVAGLGGRYEAASLGVESQDEVN